MAYYLIQWKYTQEELQGMIGTPSDREAAARTHVESFGGKLHHLFFSLGHYDGLAIIEYPDIESCAAANMSVGAITGGLTETTALMTTEEAMRAMALAGKQSSGYTPPQG